MHDVIDYDFKDSRTANKENVLKPKPTASDKQKALLKGLEALGEYYALGYEGENFFRELQYFEAESEYHTKSFGQIKRKGKALLEIVNQIRTVEEIVEMHEYKKSALIQILLDIQNKLNWLPRHIINWISVKLNVPISTIYAIANFYEVLSLEPRGAHLVQVCEGTACHVRGSSELIQRVSALLGIQPGDTDSELSFTLKSVHCLGCCALAPVIKVDDQYYSNPSIATLKKVFSTCKKKEKVENPCQN